MATNDIRIAIVGVGNCASSLIQGLAHYAHQMASDGPEMGLGLMHPILGGYTPRDIKVVAAFDVDARKVGKSLHEAVFAPPNNTQVFCSDLGETDVIVQMGNQLDGVAEHMAGYPDHRRFIVADRPDATVRIHAVPQECGAMTRRGAGL